MNWALNKWPLSPQHKDINNFPFVHPKCFNDIFLNNFCPRMIKMQRREDKLVTHDGKKRKRKLAWYKQGKEETTHETNKEGFEKLPILHNIVTCDLEWGFGIFYHKTLRSEKKETGIWPWCYGITTLYCASRKTMHSPRLGPEIAKCYDCWITCSKTRRQKFSTLIAHYRAPSNWQITNTSS